MSDLEVNYSPELDILSVDDSSREYERSVSLKDFIVDLDPSGEVRGVEIQNISCLLGVDREQLQGIEDVDLEAEVDDGVRIVLRFRMDQNLNALTAQLPEATA